MLIFLVLMLVLYIKKSIVVGRGSKKDMLIFLILVQALKTKLLIN